MAKEEDKDPNYALEEQGFWHRIDRRLEKTGASLKKFSESKYWSPFKKAGESIKAFWNSKPMAPIKWVTEKTASAINTVLKHPVTQFASFAIGMTLAATALVAAAPAAIPFAAATVGVIAGGKIVNTAYNARKAYRQEQLEKQLQLLEKLQSVQERKTSILKDLPQASQNAIKPHITKRQDSQEVHHRNLKAKSQVIAENIAANLLGVASAAMDFTQLPRSLHSASQVLDVIGTSKDTKDALGEPSEIKSESTQERRTENELRAKINSLSRELDVPKVNSNTELREFVANSVADTIALASAREPPPENQAKVFLEAKNTILKEGTHLSELPKPENGVKKTAIHVGKAFFGISSDNIVVTPSQTPQNNGRNLPSKQRI